MRSTSVALRVCFMSLLSFDRVHVTLGRTPILHDVTFDLDAGTFVGLLGPNGSGKTTLLRALSALISFKGTIRLDGRPVEAWTAAERARRLAFVRQVPSMTFDFTVDELVRLGRAPHKRWLEGYSTADRDRVREALATVDLDGCADRSVLSLSGGERQRVFLAQALVQDADLLLLDEPTSHLDVHYQFSFMDRIQAQVERGRTVLAVFHDLDLAARYADRLLVLSDGRLVADGPPQSVLTPERIASVFRIRADVVDTADGSPHIVYRGPVKAASTNGVVA
jgi:iron complex transport system ATP-binding protein